MSRSAQPWVLTLLRTIFDQPDAAEVHAQFDRVIDALQTKFPAAADHLDAARAESLAFTGFPREIWRQVWSNKRLNKEIRRRTDVVGICLCVVPTAPRCSGWSARYARSRSTNGPSSVAT